MNDGKKALPVGIEFFQDFKLNNFYYVDKTALIAEFLRTRGAVNLFTRPRRFGKSLNMDMLKSFFEIGTELCGQHMGRYPVISLSLKDVEGGDYADALEMMAEIIKTEARRHQHLLESDRLTDIDKESLKRLYALYLEESVQKGSLNLLSEMLRKHYGRRVVILIDEYDVPLDKAYQGGYYPEMVKLIRSFLSRALKTNKSLEFAVLTGCLRIARESIFTGLNNFNVFSISDSVCA